MIKIRIGDIRIEPETKVLIAEILDSNRLSEGKNIKEFERLWAEYIESKYCIATNSGTSALLAGLYALLYDDRFPKCKKGSKVITSPVTYVATSNAIVLAGMEPVYVDINPRDFTLNVEQIETVLKRDTTGEYSAILPVHLMGYPNDMDAINYLAKKYDLVVFEDAAEAHGSLYKGKKTGSLSLLSAYSFYIAHNIQVGEMGAVVTSDSRIAKLIKQIKANGRICACPICTRPQGKCPYKNQSFDPRFTHEHIGFNFKTTEFQAAIAIPQIKIADTIIETRQKNVKYLNEKLEAYADIFMLPLYSDDVSYLAYPIIIKDQRISRDALMRKLEAKGVENRPLFGCIPTHQPAYAYLKDQYEHLLPNANFVGENGFYVGCHQYLTQNDLDYMVNTFAEVVDEIL